MRERHAAVGPQLVWIDQQLRRIEHAGAHIDRRLPLQAAVLRVEQAPALDFREAGARVIPQLGETTLKVGAMGKRGQMREGDGVLRLDPRRNFGRIEIF